MSVPSISSIDEFHVWQVDEEKTIASAVVGVSGHSIESDDGAKKRVKEIFTAYGIAMSTVEISHLPE